MRRLAALLLVLPVQEPAVNAVQTPDPPSQHPANHLEGQTSPYLLQHAHNPVDWYPWGDEALDRALRENKPIFLSIGYSACHWCHVMERESFENEEIATYLNQHFISIKVDREERPDLDDLYMSAVQAMTGSGGWPMTVFLTPQRKPFYGGTYFPPTNRGGRPGFMELLHGIEQAWREDHAKVLEVAEQLGGHLEMRMPALTEKIALPDPAAFALSLPGWVQAWAKDYDPQWGGFGPAPKFPPSQGLRWLLRTARSLPAAQAEHARSMALDTLRHMASGGMYDQLGGGFARYSVEGTWMVPHFEKMLYDQACLIPAYLEGWRASGDPALAAVVRDTCDYLLRERRDPEGAFWSATDADSEGEEGLYFVWTQEQLEEVLGAEDARLAAHWYGVTTEGNFEHGRSILSTRQDPEEVATRLGLEGDLAPRIESIRLKLLQARAKRVPPHNDDKVLTAWNGLAIDALAQAGRMLGEPRYTEAAATAARFLLQEMRRGETEDAPARWLRSWRHGHAQHAAVLEDHAYLCRAFLSLFQSTGDPEWLDHASDLASILEHRFLDPVSGVFFDTDGSDASLLTRRQTPWDGALPSANAVALEAFATLHALGGDRHWLELAQRGVAAVLPMAQRNPRAFPATLLVLPLVIEEPPVAVVIGTGRPDSVDAWRSRLMATDVDVDLVVFRATPDLGSDSPLFLDRNARDGLATLYLCRGSTCLLPQTDPASLRTD